MQVLGQAYAANTGARGLHFLLTTGDKSIRQAKLTKMGASRNLRMQTELGPLPTSFPASTPADQDQLTHLGLWDPETCGPMQHNTNHSQA